MRSVCHLFRFYIARFGGWIHYLRSFPVGIIGVTWWFMRSKTVDRLSLKKTLDYRPSPFEGMDLKPGDKGISVTRLTLIGNADFNGHIIEVQSADGSSMKKRR